MHSKKLCSIIIMDRFVLVSFAFVLLMVKPYQNPYQNEHEK